jgi:hypothetical protein
MKNIIDLLVELEMKHSVCEDSWYSCPKSGENYYTDGHRNNTQCDCGADENNEKLRIIIKKINEEGI